MSTTTVDSSLVRRLQQRDRVAWEELYAGYEPRLKRFALSLAGNPHDADDLVSETFLRALPALDRLDADEVNLEAYLFTTTRNLFLKQVERTKRAEPVADVPEPLVPVAIEDDPERSTMLGAQQAEVRLANASLQPRQRLVLALCELEERSYAEIGELVGINENAVAQLVFRARESLRTELRLLQVDPERLPEECRAFLPALSQYLDGQLREPRKSTTLAHLEGCERCQAALADMREAQRRYRALFLPLGLPAEEARAALDRDLEASGYWQEGSRVAVVRRRRSKAVVAGAIGAALLCLAGGVGAAKVISRGTADEAIATTTPAPPASTAPATTAPAVPATTATPPPPPAPATTTTTAGTTAPATVSTPAPTTTEAPATTAAATTAPAPPPPPPPPSTAPKPPKVVAPPIDVTPPVVSITRAPPASTPETAASVSFASSEAKTSFECRVDAGAWKACSTPHALAGLTVGDHVIAVRGTDPAGNKGQATAAWKVIAPPDTTPPTVTITGGPQGSTTATSATIAFAGGEPGLAFTCSLDGAVPAACASPVAYTVGVGGHTVVVRATDAAGNSGEASRSWTVTAPPQPDLLISSLRNNGVTVRNAGTAASGVTVLVVTGLGSAPTTFTLPALASGQTFSFSWACKAGTLTATADPGNTVPESNEGNNTMTRQTSCLGFGN